MKDPIVALQRLRDLAKRSHVHQACVTCLECGRIEEDYQTILTAGRGEWQSGDATPPVKLNVVPPAGGEEVTHICAAGQVVCGTVSGPPSSWPRGHFRVGASDAEKATCPRCLDLFLARNHGT